MSRNRLTLNVLQISRKNLLIQGKDTVACELQEKAELVWLKGHKKKKKRRVGAEELSAGSFP